MNRVNRKYLVTFFGILILVMAFAYTLNIIIPQPNSKPNNNKSAYDSQYSYFTIRDTGGTLLLQTGLPVHTDDEYINENNYHYRIIKVQGNQAVAKLIDTPKLEKQSNTGTIPVLAPSIPAQANGPTHVVLYHTHTDESFIPTSGTAAKPGNGDVFQVGDTITTVLNQAGISVTHSRAKHDPHDVNAYSRSRRTLTQLLKEQPDAAFDIHRDSAPLNSYIATVNGITTSRVMIVIGRSNPNMQTNLKYARSVKDQADRLHPGLMRGIFMGKGDYNQDLYPTALIFEIGTENISLNAAQKAAACLCDAIIAVAYAK